MLYFLGMNDPRLAAALLTSSPDALAELFDAYGDRLFRYCWSMLRSRELAQVALRDALLVAQAHIARLADPEDPTSLGPWLYSLARAECRRHQAVPPADADESPARLGLPAADARLMSWNAAMSLEAAEFEALDLACRHYVDLGQVLGLPAAAAEDLLDRARQHLERALGTEILAGRGPGCPDLDALLAEVSLTAEVRERVLEHADRCEACGPEVPRNVSATRIFALLPAPPWRRRTGPRSWPLWPGTSRPPLPPWPRPHSSRSPPPRPRFPPPRPPPRFPPPRPRFPRPRPRFPPQLQPSRPWRLRGCSGCCSACSRPVGNGSASRLVCACP
jgi:DNA-directed RNA polymerase specialized sigma24 family protein